ncbi:porin family protein [Dawidia soli]|uniref:Outer membrane beta-barrel protein n=1 Tax=Dawidia soli TaxID=2782352 RepID=A0AAP2DE30_9BACT|nr:porin family protein [Dawidia soli]MBT1690333.1 outer membrane beta-barrel protein [Dawidia soli]
MKKNIITLIMAAMAFAGAVVLPQHASAQDDERVWSIGPELGINLAKYGDDASDTDFKTGILGGGFITYSIRNTHAFTGKVLFSQKGAKDGDEKQTLNYVEVPVIVRLFFNRDGAFRPNLFAGPSFGFLTGVRSKEGDGDYVKLDDYGDFYNTFDLGVTAGLGFNYECSPGTRILIDARYTHGLNDISKSSSVSVINQAIGITAGISFGI